jgi:CMP-N,N'-diacetyllegionaminic acid synthase
MKIYAIIPARGGSKGVPRKNVRLLQGKPLIAWTIEAAKNVQAIDRVFVSTEDDEIAHVAESYGAEVLKRPLELAEDLTLDLPVFQYHLQNFQSTGELPDAVVDLRATAPLRTSEHIIQGIDLLLQKGDSVDSVRAVVDAPKHPYKMWNLNDDILTPFLPKSFTGMHEPFNVARQLLPVVYQNNGAVNVIWSQTILQKESMTGSAIAGYEMDAVSSINIDSEIDFMMAELLMAERNKS